MRDAASECPDSLHFLRLSQLSLQLFLVGLRLLLSADIDCRADEPIGLAAPVPQAAATCEHPAPLAVALADAVFAFIARRSSLEVIG